MINRPARRRDKNHNNEDHTMAGYCPNRSTVGGGIAITGGVRNE
jgi:hypothetical protein